MKPSLPLTLLIICISNLFLYFIIFHYHSLISFNAFQYAISAHHYLPDPQLEHRFSLLPALAQYDAQWYLKIATLGYPANPPSPPLLADPDILSSGIAFAFFPLYPLFLFILNIFIHDILLAAFSLSLILILANVISLRYVVSRLFSVSIATKTILLIFTFPFGIFYRSYYAEGLQLLLLIWFIYFFHQRRLWPAALFLALENIVKSNLWSINILFIFYACYFTKSFKKILIYLPLLGFPLFIWFIFNYIRTGSFWYFLSAFKAWYPDDLVQYCVRNYIFIGNFFRHHLHAIHSSQIEIVSFLSVIIIFFLARKKIPLYLWIMGMSIAITPLITKDLASYSRYQSISLPLFLALSHLLPSQFEVPLYIIFYCSLLAASLYFVNWWWIG